MIRFLEGQLKRQLLLSSFLIAIIDAHQASSNGLPLLFYPGGGGRPKKLTMFLIRRWVDITERSPALAEVER